jgi:steroid 5-alpha reductase family enzyme
MNEFFCAEIDIQHLSGIWLIIMVTAAGVCFLVSEITLNYSQVDKLWSLLPIGYSLVTLASFPVPRIWIMSILVTLWGFRLSYNFHRKGGYNIIPWKGEEDYRWTILRQHPLLRGRIRFGLFNLFFISLYQNILILLFSTPLLMAAKFNASPITWIDMTAATLMLLFLSVETVADNQLWRFQKIKKHMEESGGLYTASLKNGFMSEGLWGYVRHPNFAAEQAIWISFYLFSSAASGQLLNWTLAGAFLLVLLFLGSSEMTENISSSRYPAYNRYKIKVPRFLPRIFRSVKN